MADNVVLLVDEKTQDIVIVYRYQHFEDTNLDDIDVWILSQPEQEGAHSKITKKVVYNMNRQSIIDSFVSKGYRILDNYV